MNILKNIALDSITYGSVTIIARLLNYAMVYFHVRWFSAGEYGVFSQFYSVIAVLNVVYILGLETTFFRFINSTTHSKRKIGNLQTLLLGWSLLLSTGLWIFANDLSELIIHNNQYANYIRYMALIVFVDAICSIPFVWLRYERKTKRYVVLKVLSILINIGLQFLFIYQISNFTNQSLTSLDAVFLANVIASICILVLLWKKIIIQITFDKIFLKEVIIYSFPLMVGGLGGIINNMSDRIMIPFLASSDSAIATAQNGIYAANYKISILMVLFIQAYRLGVEPFLFKLFKEDRNAPLMYAKLMNVFVIVGCVLGLCITLFLHLWKYWIVSDRHPEYQEGILVVPILVLANLILGIYFNLTIWFKVTNKTSFSVFITILASIISIGLNFWLIPLYSYWASAWITLFVYSLMVCITFIVGRYKYPIPYSIAKMGLYLFASILISTVYILYIAPKINQLGWLTACSVLMLLLFLILIKKQEQLKWQMLKGVFTKALKGDGRA